MVQIIKDSTLNRKLAAKYIEGRENGYNLGYYEALSIIKKAKVK
jgi:hypothetical protein